MEQQSINSISFKNVPPVLEPVASDPADASAWLAAIVENSSDAILSKTLGGIITSWNEGAVRLFGYSPDEAIGRPITMIIPDDRLHEEDEIIASLRRGERVSRLETVRRAKDGRLIDVELSISPVCDVNGRVVGASKIARDISERHELAERQALLLREMNHRIKNLFAIVQGLVGVCKRSADDVDDFAADLCGRLMALNAAHSLILPGDETLGGTHAATLCDVLDAVLAPYADVADISWCVCSTAVGSNSLTSLALMFHELATNAVKYGALTVDGGKLEIEAKESAGMVELRWSEQGVLAQSDETEGFGTALQRSALRSLGGTLDRKWTEMGLEIRLSLPVSRLIY